jgi:hypothetical protein
MNAMTHTITQSRPVDINQRREQLSAADLEAIVGGIRKAGENPQEYLMYKLSA